MALYRNGFFPSHPEDPSFVFDELLMDVLYYSRFAALLSVVRGVKAISHLQLFSARLEFDGDLSVDYDRLVAVLPYYAALKAAVNQMSSLGLGRRELPLCPACGDTPHCCHTDGCFQVSRQVGATVSTRPTIYEGRAIVVSPAPLQDFMDLIDTTERQAQEKRRKDASAARQLAEDVSALITRCVDNCCDHLTSCPQNSVFTMGCESHHRAVTNAFQPAKKHMDITGTSFTVCRHGSVLRAAPMKGGERYDTNVPPLH